MKNTLILHGTDGYPTENWFDWLRIELEKEGHKVWVPQLPDCNKPNVTKYNNFLFENKEWAFNKESIIIGHSSGAVAILGLLETLPDDVIVDTCYLVGSFKNNLDWDALDDLFLKPFDFEKIKNKARKFIFLHSDNDPYCPLEHAQYLRNQVNGTLILLRDQKHFSIGTAGDKYKEFPFLFDLIVNN
jgi:predicted alpha/beta hydrolase family esterase